MQQHRMYKNKNNVFDVRERDFVYVCKCEWVFEYVVLSLSSAHINMPSLNIFQLIGHKNFTRTFLFILPAFLFVFDTNEERNSSTITTTKPSLVREGMKLCCEVTSLQKYSFRNKKPDTDPTNSTTLETNTRMKR